MSLSCPPRSGKRRTNPDPGNVANDCGTEGKKSVHSKFYPHNHINSLHHPRAVSAPRFVEITDATSGPNSDIDSKRLPFHTISETRGRQAETGVPTDSLPCFLGTFVLNGFRVNFVPRLLENRYRVCLPKTYIPNIRCLPTSVAYLCHVTLPCLRKGSYLGLGFW